MEVLPISADGVNDAVQRHSSWGLSATVLVLVAAAVAAFLCYRRHRARRAFSDPRDASREAVVCESAAPSGGTLSQSPAALTILVALPRLVQANDAAGATMNESAAALGPILTAAAPVASPQGAPVALFVPSLGAPPQNTLYPNLTSPPL